jgi:hypothetical protein
MNTSSTKARLTTRGAAMAACLAALFAGATACGTEDGTASAKTRAASSIDQLESAKANQSQYLQRLHAAIEAARQARAEKADAARWARGNDSDSNKAQRFGDDRRQQQGQTHTPPPHDAPGYDKALPGNY